MKLAWIFLVVSHAVLMGCQREASTRPAVNLVYDQFFEAFTRAFGVDATNGNFVVHHGGDAVLGTLVMHSKTKVPSPTTEHWDYRSWESLRISLSALRRDTYDDFWARNAEPQELTLTEAGSWRVHLLSDTEAAELRSLGEKDADRGFWGPFRERFPRGQLTGISAPGISRDGSQMLIYLYSGFGPLAASASYYLLEKKGSAWEIADEWVLWVS